MLSELQRNKDAIQSTVLGAEITRQRQEELTQTLIVRLFKHTFLVVIDPKIGEPLPSSKTAEPKHRCKNSLRAYLATLGSDPFNVRISALYALKNPRYRSIPIQTRRSPVPRKTQQKSQRSAVDRLVSIIKTMVEPTIMRTSLIQIATYLKL